MVLTPEIIAQIAVLISAFSAFIGAGSAALVARHNSRTTARKDELIRLDEKVQRLERKLQREIDYRLKLLDYIGILIVKMRGSGLEVPPIPEMMPIEDEVDPSTNR
jgi:hypothetical protein